MTGPRATTPELPSDHPLRAALARGDRAHARSVPALQYLVAAPDHSLIGEAVVAQVRGMLADLARQLIEASQSESGDSTQEAMLARLLAEPELRAHCQALALEWRLAQRLESELAVDPVLSPLLQVLIGRDDGGTGSLAMATLAAQARFAQTLRRMELPLAELPAELFHAVLAAAREVLSIGASEVAMHGEGRLRTQYDEGSSRLALLARLAREAAAHGPEALGVEEAGVALWLSVVASRSGESRERLACAAVDSHLGRLLLTLRAAGMTAADAERQALRFQPDADLPRGLDDIGTREAAQWLSGVQP